MIQRLSDREPNITAERLLDDFVPPPLFRSASFDSYIPDPSEPTQAAAVAGLRVFAERVSKPNQAKRGLFRRAAPPESRPGIYLDGGFGVGKTHLLAALYATAPEPKSFGTFVEYTNLVGALGFRSTVEVLSRRKIVCIDEFELDDPGDTVLMSTLLGELVSAGVFLAATSNTLPDRLGEERFAAEDFLREIQGLADHFDVLRIDGPDYRHRGEEPAPHPATNEQVVAAVAADPTATCDDFRSLVRHLSRVHPSRYGAMVAGVSLSGWIDVTGLRDQAEALRLVVLIDRLYDRDIPVIASGLPVDSLFSPEMLGGGYRKKYFRALSRLVALAREGSAVVG